MTRQVSEKNTNREPVARRSPQKIRLLAVRVENGARMREPLGLHGVACRRNEFDRQDFCGAGRRPAAVAGPRGRRLPHPHPDPGAGHPALLAGRTCWASPRPAPARPRRSRCRSCSASRRTPRPAAAARARVPGPGARRASSRSRSTRASDLRPPSGLRHTVIFGGVGQQPQVKALRRGVDILVATPGRLLDLMRQGRVDARPGSRCSSSTRPTGCSTWASSPTSGGSSRAPAEARQNAAVLGDDADGDRRARRATCCDDPGRVEVDAATRRRPTRSSSACYSSRREDKRALLATCCANRQLRSVLVFTRTKHGADRVAEQLDEAASRAAAIHGNKSQNARQRALDGVQARRRRGAGRDRHRGARHRRRRRHPRRQLRPAERAGGATCTGSVAPARAGAAGVALSFCDASERGLLRASSA